MILENEIKQRNLEIDAMRRLGPILSQLLDGLNWSNSACEVKGDLIEASLQIRPQGDYEGTIQVLFSANLDPENAEIKDISIGLNVHNYEDARAALRALAGRPNKLPDFTLDTGMMLGPNRASYFIYGDPHTKPSDLTFMGKPPEKVSQEELDRRRGSFSGQAEELRVDLAPSPGHLCADGQISGEFKHTFSRQWYKNRTGEDLCIERFFDEVRGLYGACTDSERARVADELLKEYPFPWQNDGPRYRVAWALGVGEEELFECIWQAVLSKEAPTAFDLAFALLIRDAEELAELKAEIAGLRASERVPASEDLKERVEPTTGIERIAAERARQIAEEGWAPEHDDRHKSGEIAKAAECYVLVGHVASTIPGSDLVLLCDWLSHSGRWPWSRQSLKPSPNRVRNFEKAGALIAAEIDRLLRLPSDESDGTAPVPVEPNPVEPAGSGAKPVPSKERNTASAGARGRSFLGGVLSKLEVNTAESTHGEVETALENGTKVLTSSPSDLKETEVSGLVATTDQILALAIGESLPIGMACPHGRNDDYEFLAEGPLRTANEGEQEGEVRTWYTRTLRRFDGRELFHWTRIH